MTLCLLSLPCKIYIDIYIYPINHPRQRRQYVSYRAGCDGYSQFLVIRFPIGGERNSLGAPRVTAT